MDISKNFSFESFPFRSQPFISPSIARSQLLSRASVRVGKFALANACPRSPAARESDGPPKKIHLHPKERRCGTQPPPTRVLCFFSQISEGQLGMPGLCCCELGAGATPRSRIPTENAQTHSGKFCRKSEQPAWTGVVAWTKTRGDG